jgi:hypothetical protein
MSAVLPHVARREHRDEQALSDRLSSPVDWQRPQGERTDILALAEPQRSNLADLTLALGYLRDEDGLELFRLPND